MVNYSQNGGYPQSNASYQHPNLLNERILQQQQQQQQQQQNNTPTSTAVVPNGFFQSCSADNGLAIQNLGYEGLCGEQSSSKQSAEHSQLVHYSGSYHTTYQQPTLSGQLQNNSLAEVQTIAPATSTQDSVSFASLLVELPPENAAKIAAALSQNPTPEQPRLQLLMTSQKGTTNMGHLETISPPSLAEVGEPEQKRGRFGENSQQQQQQQQIMQYTVSNQQIKAMEEKEVACFASPLETPRNAAQSELPVLARSDSYHIFWPMFYAGGSGDTKTLFKCLLKAHESMIALEIFHEIPLKSWWELYKKHWHEILIIEISYADISKQTYTKFRSDGNKFAICGASERARECVVSLGFTHFQRAQFISLRVLDAVTKDLLESLPIQTLNCATQKRNVLSNNLQQSTRGCFSHIHGNYNEHVKASDQQLIAGHVFGIYSKFVNKYLWYAFDCLLKRFKVADFLDKFPDV